MEEFTINIPGVVTLHSRGRIKDVCFRLQHEQNVVVECKPVYVPVPDQLPPSQTPPPPGQESRLKTVKCIEGDWSFIRVHHGDIASQQVDVIVNRIGSDLNLSSGAGACKALLQAGGRALQDDCDQYRQQRGELQAGDIAVMSGGESLSCLFVFHVNLPLYTSRRSLKLYREVIDKCLWEANYQTAKSIAFPLLGVSTLCYPVEDVAQELLDKCIAYYRRREGEIKHFHFVAFKENEYKEMNKALMKRFLSNALIPVVITKQCDDETDDAATPKAHPIFLDIVQGEIAKQASDVIVNITNTKLDLKYGPVSCSILASGGEDIEYLCEQLVDNDITLLAGKVESTKSGGDLMCKRVFHILDPYIATSTQSSTLTEYTESICLAVLMKAEDYKVSSLSIPLLSTDKGVIEDVCNAMVKACKQFSQQEVQHVEKVSVVVSDSQEMKICNQQLSRVFPSFANSIKLPFDMTAYGKVGLPDVSELSAFNAVHFTATGPTPEAIQRAKEMIEMFVKQETVSKKTDYAFMSQCSSNDIKHLHLIGQKHGVMIQASNTSFTLHGDSHSVLMAQISLLDYLHSLKPAGQANTKWQHIVDNVYSDFDPHMSSVLEQQHSKGTEKIYMELENPSQRCVFDLKHMTVVDVDTGSSHKIDRKTFTSMENAGTLTGLWSLPSHWDPQPIGVNGRPERCHQVTLVCDSQEYKNALRTFQNTLPPSQCDIVEVKRIQNPYLYQQYSTMKAVMKHDVPKDHQLERELFHGTNKDACEKINHQGFNRMFAGKNAAYYGKGVYFAVDADYSSQEVYSPADDNGCKYIYSCLALTGEYTKGDPSMTVPPAKNPEHNEAILYNSLVDNVKDPRIFVAVKDNQVYPQYLIVFQMKF